MPRFAARPLRWADIDKRFEGHSAQEHFRNAISYIQKLEHDGRVALKDEPQKFARWQELCQELTQYIRIVRPAERDFSTNLREFIHTFEHAQLRAYQISYGSDGFAEPISVDYVLDWLDFIFKHSTYAILAAHIPDKQEINTRVTHIDMEYADGKLITKSTTTTGALIPPTVPRKYRGMERRP